MLHNLKLQRKYADRIIDGQKTFEVRLNDRDYQVGDIIIFNTVENNNADETVTHKINNKEYEITYIHTNYGMDSDYLETEPDLVSGRRRAIEYDFVVLGIKPVKK